ncbi:hypothetical protein FKM82_019662 [Ascaphus truei]
MLHCRSGSLLSFSVGRQTLLPSPLKLIPVNVACLSPLSSHSFPSCPCKQQPRQPQAGESQREGDRRRAGASSCIAPPGHLPACTPRAS